MSQIIFTLRAIQYPSSIPLSLASLNLITSTSASFSHTVIRLLDETGSIADQWANVRKIYEVSHIPNKVEDGKAPYPENQLSVLNGIEVEFRFVRRQCGDSR